MLDIPDGKKKKSIKKTKESYFESELNKLISETKAQKKEKVKI